MNRVSLVNVYLKNRKIDFAIASEHCVYFSTQFFLDIFGYYFVNLSTLSTKIDNFSKNKNRKFVSHFFQNIALLFRTKNLFWPIRGRCWVCMLLIGTGPYVLVISKCEIQDIPCDDTTYWQFFSESCWTKSNLDCNYTFPIDFEPIWIPFGAKLIWNWYLQFKFALI